MPKIPIGLQIVAQVNIFSWTAAFSTRGMFCMLYKTDPIGIVLKFFHSQAQCGQRKCLIFNVWWQYHMFKNKVFQNLKEVRDAFSNGWFWPILKVTEVRIIYNIISCSDNVHSFCYFNILLFYSSFFNSNKHLSIISASSDHVIYNNVFVIFTKVSVDHKAINTYSC